MFRLNRLHLQALAAWELTVTATLAVLILAMKPNHMWNKNDLVFFAYVTVCGIFVTAAIAFLSRPFGNVGALLRAFSAALRLAS